MLFIIFNPIAGRGRALYDEVKLIAALRRYGLQYVLVRTARGGHARELAVDAVQSGHYSAVVAAGGDGTLNEVVNGLLGSDVPLGVVPIGTGNDFCKVLDLKPGRLDEAVRRLAAGTARPVDVGVANGRAFINGLGCGLEAQTTVESQRLTRLRGFAVYAVALLLALRRYRSPNMRVRLDGETVEYRMLAVSAGNGRCVGGGFWITPAAEIDDGRLDICLIRDMPLPDIARHLPKLLNGSHVGIPQVRMARVQDLVIESDAPVPAHVDGELLGTDLTRIEVTILPGAMRLIR